LPSVATACRANLMGRHDRAALAGDIESWKADYIHASVEIVSG